MQTTTNIGLKTYEANDPTDWLGEFNYNMNKIDEAVGSQNDAIDVIEETAGTAITTANTASATATEALTTAEAKTSINDNVASASTTYSSNKINALISGIQPGTEIDDTVTSTTKTWSSSKINTEISAKASINDTTASSSTTYSSNKIDSLISSDFPDYSNVTQVATSSTVTNNRMNLTYTATEDCYLLARIEFTPTDNSYALISINTSSFVYTINFENHPYTNLESQIFKVKAGSTFDITVFDVNSTATKNLLIYKLPITN